MRLAGQSPASSVSSLANAPPKDPVQRRKEFIRRRRHQADQDSASKVIQVGEDHLPLITWWRQGWVLDLLGNVQNRQGGPGEGRSRGDGARVEARRQLEGGQCGMECLSSLSPQLLMSVQE